MLDDCNSELPRHNGMDRKNKIIKGLYLLASCCRLLRVRWSEYLRIMMSTHVANVGVHFTSVWFCTRREVDRWAWYMNLMGLTWFLNGVEGIRLLVCIGVCENYHLLNQALTLQILVLHLTLILEDKDVFKGSGMSQCRM